jgi:hypothetical protein
LFFVPLFSALLPFVFFPRIPYPVAMPRPNVIFFCELGPLALTELFETPGLIDTLESQQYGVALALLDFSPQRAAVVRCLNARGIPVTAWLLLPMEEGYWFNLHNYPQAAVAYHSFREWAVRENLAFVAVGLDIEPSLAQMHAARRQGSSSIFNRAFLAQSNALYPAARDAYLDLAATIRHDGYAVHTYQYPFIVDDRRAGTTVIQRMLDIVDVPADEEVLMLYSSNFFRGLFRSDLGGAFVRSYGQHADSIGIGVTGGGVVLDPISGLQSPRMSLEAFRRDLRLAAQYTDLVHIFSLEGCVDRGWLPELAALDWERPVRVTRRQRMQMWAFRSAIGFGLWCSRYGWAALGWLGWLVAGSMFISRRIQRWRTLRRIRSYDA